MFYYETYARVAPFCDYCSCDFTRPPVFIRGQAEYAVHHPDDEWDNDCAYWHDWQEYGRWQTGRGMQGSRTWPDGREWLPGPVTDRPTHAWCRLCRDDVSLCQKMGGLICSECRTLIIGY